MVTNVKEYHVPGTVEQAINLLARDMDTRVLAGGSSLVRMKNLAIEALVDIRKLNLSYVKEESGRTAIGAATTVTEMLEHPLVAKLGGGVMKEACAAIADTPLRNVITLGGNIAKIYYWCDLPAVLLALEAEIVVQGKDGKRVIDAETFFSKQPARLLDKSEIITEVIFPVIKGQGLFHKFAKTKVDYAIFDVVVYLEKEGKVCKKARIAISGCTNLPKRWKILEKSLEGKELTGELIDTVVSSALDQIIFRPSPLESEENNESDDAEEPADQVIFRKTYKASNEYRRHVLGYYTKGSLLKLSEA
ncbi:MAG: FAD binding domain-containing protein [Candidatus Odinarchaeota archaeon]